MGHSLEVVVLRIGDLHISLISIRVNLVEIFMLNYRVPLKVRLDILIIMARVVVIL